MCISQKAKPMCPINFHRLLKRLVLLSLAIAPIPTYRQPSTPTFQGLSALAFCLDAMALTSASRLAWASGKVVGIRSKSLSQPNRTGQDVCSVLRPTLWPKAAKPSASAQHCCSHVSSRERDIDQHVLIEALGLLFVGFRLNTTRLASTRPLPNCPAPSDACGWVSFGPCRFGQCGRRADAPPPPASSQSRSPGLVRRSGNHPGEFAQKGTYMIIHEHTKTVENLVFALSFFPSNYRST